ncbi:MAG: LysM domain-containing protein [Polyangiaceae bacterium]|nr:LysM domain-containing protein [Polyangiaceae bacterium]
MLTSVFAQRFWCSRLLLAFSLVLGVMVRPREAQAFVHVVQKNETLAAIAERFYGRIQFEKLLVAANSLDAQGGSSITPGMRLEVPAVSYEVIRAGQTWDTLAERLLGAADRSDVLSLANGSKPWLPPEEGAQIVIPYNLRIIATERDSTISLAYKFLGDKQKAWVLDRYNHRSGKAIERGDVVLIPLFELPLTSEGKTAALASSEATCTQSLGEQRQLQLAVSREIPALLSDIRGARYVDAVARGVRFLAQGNITKAQKGIVHRQLLEAYAALGAVGLAIESCSGWLENDPKANLDPSTLSPKLMAACGQVRKPNRATSPKPPPAAQP